MFWPPIFGEGRPGFLYGRLLVRFTVLLSSVCWPSCATPGNGVECRIYWGWVKMQVQVIVESVSTVWTANRISWRSRRLTLILADWEKRVLAGGNRYLRIMLASKHWLMTLTAEMAAMWHGGHPVSSPLTSSGMTSHLMSSSHALPTTTRTFSSKYVFVCRNTYNETHIATFASSVQTIL